MSETETARPLLAPFCEKGCGVDLGFGGYEPIVKHALCLDRKPGSPGRAAGQEWPTHLVCDIFGRLPFEDDSLDWVYSSHALEDTLDTAGALREWVRVIKPGGHLVLFLPDQATYAAFCLIHHQLPNQDHKHSDFGIEFVKSRLPKNVKVVFERFPFEGNPYSFGLVAQKLSTVSPIQQNGYKDKMYED